MKFKACYILKSNVVLSCNRVRVVSNLGERKVRSNISNTRKSVSSDIQTLRSRSEKRGAAEFFLELQSVWIFDETLFRVFDIASQNINNS